MIDLIDNVPRLIKSKLPIKEKKNLIVDVVIHKWACLSFFFCFEFSNNARTKFIMVENHFLPKNLLNVKDGQEYNLSFRYTQTKTIAINIKELTDYISNT